MYLRCRSALRREFCAASIFILPSALFYITLFSLIFYYSGHRHAILGRNPFCTDQSAVPAHLRQPWGQTSSAPQIVLQISDLHINDYDSGVAKQHLQAFVQTSLPNWAAQASAVLVTGDLVDSEVPTRYPFGISSAQIAEEWDFVHEIASSVNRTIPWIAVHGNHDTFGHVVHEHPFSASAALLTCSNDTYRNRRVRKITTEFTDEKLQLLAMECSLPNPLNRPLNFFGDATVAAEQLSQTLSEIESETSSSNILAFAHYPSSIMKNGKHIHDVISSHSAESSQKSKVAAYLSGHLHTLYGVASSGLQAVSKSGTFELEVADMIGSSTYRVLIFDNGFLSFRDMKVGDASPEIVVTNPPRAGFCSMGAGTASRTSTHIRVVVSKTHIGESHFVAEIDGELLRKLEPLDVDCTSVAEKTDCRNVLGVVWNASKYDDDAVHRLTIHAPNGQTVEHAFSLDGRPEEGWMAYIGALRSAILLFTEFDQVAAKLCAIGFGLCFLFVLPGLRRLQAMSIGLCVLCLVLYTLPVFIVAPNLTSDGWGSVGVHSILLASGLHPAGVDSPYIISVTVLWRTLVPICFLDLMFTNQVSTAFKSWLLPLFIFAVAKDCFGWTLEICGAHGIASAALSFAGLPLFIATLFAALKYGLVWKNGARSFQSVEHR